MAIEQADGDPITGISSMATRHVLAELADTYTRLSGQQVTIVSAGGVDAVRRVQEGEAFDFVVLAADAIAPRIVQAPPGVPVGTLVARGDVELGFQQLSELMHLPGIEVIGLLPAEIQAVTIFSAAVCTVSRRRAAAEALLAFLASPEADATTRRH